MNAKEAVTDFQLAMRKLGFYNGEIDGDFGPLSCMAAQQYFKPLDTYIPGWMVWASQELGVSEIYGDKANPRIIHYHSFTGLGAQSDEIAWCSSFVNAGLIEGAGMLGTRSAAAASFRRYGNSVSVKTYGAIQLVATNTGSKRHVFFNAGYWKGYCFGLGGNQSDKVNVVARHYTQITESRYPIID